MKRMALVFVVLGVTSVGCKKKSADTGTAAGSAAGSAAAGSAAAGSGSDMAGSAAGSGSDMAAGSSAGSAAAGSATGGSHTATATLDAKSGSKVKGTITFKEVAGGVEATANLEGLTPGDHAWHVHEKGDCSSADGKSAGGHFNPMNMDHGAPDADKHHAGDFGNLTADKDGKAQKTFVMKGITLGADNMSIVGKGFIVHDKADDFKTQPTGNAGDRVACGVITAAP